MKMLNKKAYTIAELPMIAITFGTAVIVLSIVGDIVGDVRETQTVNSSEANISDKGAAGLQKIANWLPTVGLVIGAVIVIVALSILFTAKFAQR